MQENLPKLSCDFVEQLIATHGDKADEWLDKFAEIIHYAQHKWNLIDLQTVANLSCNYVAYGFSRVYNQEIVLKCAVVTSECYHEKDALLYFNVGMNKLLDYAENFGILLLAKVGTGLSLKNLYPQHEEQAIWHAAKLIQLLHVTPKTIPTENNYPRVADWLKILVNFKHSLINNELIQLGQKISTYLQTTAKQTYLLHGDLHHENILQDSLGNWLAIDPHGVIGEIYYEIGAFMRNPIPELLNLPNAQLVKLLAQRIDRFAILLDLDKSRVAKYSYLTTLLAIIWNLEDNGTRWPLWLQLLNNLKEVLSERGLL